MSVSEAIDRSAFQKINLVKKIGAYINALTDSLFFRQIYGSKRWTGFRLDQAKISTELSTGFVDIHRSD